MRTPDMNVVPSIELIPETRRPLGLVRDDNIDMAGGKTPQKVGMAI